MNLLIIGTLPPPIGGVTIHISRINEFLKEKEIPYTFIDYRKNSFFDILKKIREYKIIHLHTSNVFFKLIIAVYCFFLNKKSILTFHGNLKQYSGWRYFINNLALKITKIPIVLNEDSLKIGKKINKNTQYITAFIPPLSSVKSNCDKENIEKIDNFISHQNVVVCSTNGKYALDKNGEDLYGVLELIELFDKLGEKYKLIISDPTKSYLKKIDDEQINVPKNILILTNEHSFIHVIKRSDIIIRNTTTDGDALTIKEGLFYNKMILATDVVDRHNLVKCYKLHDINSLKRIIENSYKTSLDYNFDENGAKDLADLYKSL
ncbi:hypothetical protein UJ101_00298 [Flavobacteriaceae bacterium UJ101]|nr:hypothetical protein UJ101_00298 [Flavobacteriaceae bacterium UJ101]